jgi:hypothetical protein
MEIRRPDLSAPPPPASATLDELVAKLGKGKRGFPAAGRVVADRGHAFAAPAADLPPLSEAAAELTRDELLVVLDDRLVCTPPLALDGGAPAAGTTGAALRRPMVISLDDPVVALERATTENLDCTRWLEVARNPLAPSERIAQPLRLLWLPATLAAPLVAPATRGATRAYLNLKGIAGGKAHFDVVYEDTEKQRWRRVGFEHRLKKDRPTGVALVAGHLNLINSDGKPLRTLPAEEVKPRARRRR